MPTIATGDDRVTAQQVFNAANTLFLRGQKVSPKAVREFLGGGSNNSIYSGLEQWWQTAGPALAPRMEIPSVPDELIDVLQKMWANLVDAAADTFDTERRKLLEEQAEKEKALQLKIASHEENALQLTAEINAQNRELAEKTSTIQGLNEKIADLETSNAHLTKSLASEQAEHARSAAEHEGAMRTIAAHVTALESRLDAQYAKSAEISRERDTVAGELRAAEAAREELKTHNTTLTEALEISRSEGVVLAERLAAQEARTVATEADLKQTHELRDRLRQELDAVHQQTEHLQAIIDQVSTQNSQLAADAQSSLARLDKAKALATSALDRLAAKGERVTRDRAALARLMTEKSP
jgi:chromosome segregation ATPase